MYRPSRDAWESATTTRYEGSFFLPVRVRRIFTAISSPPESVFPFYDIPAPSRFAFRKYIGKRVRRTGSRGASSPLRSRPCARSLPVPLDAISPSLHRPLRGTPRCALCAQTDSIVSVFARRCTSGRPRGKTVKEFVHLHLHSQYSLLDGAIKIEELVRKVARMGMPAVALTDHGGMIGAVDFYEKANREGIKPIIGAEVYLTTGSRHDRKALPGEDRSHHLILLAESNEGYRNLIQLVSRAHVEGFYYKPRVDKEILREHAKGIIATSACLQGEIPVLLAQEGNTRAAEAVEE